jgi:NADPH:quinone reductase-like Zn-dependent oxidoreductase
VTATMRTLCFHGYGEPGDVLRLEQVPVPDVRANRVRVAVHACALNPADWALCRGLFARELPRGVGLDVSGTIDAVGEGVTDVAIGDAVFGSADFAGESTAGAGDFAILDRWFRVPLGLSMDTAAAMPLVTETAYRSIENLGVQPGQTVLVHAAGTAVGFAAVQIALHRGARVIATAGHTNTAQLRSFGAKVTTYDDGVAERVSELAGGRVDLALDVGPATGVLPELLRVVDGDGRRLMTFADLAGAAKLGVRTIFEGPRTLYYDKLPDYAQRAADATYFVPIGRTFSLDEWRAAMELSISGHPHGKILLRPDRGAHFSTETQAAS